MQSRFFFLLTGPIIVAVVVVVALFVCLFFFLPFSMPSSVSISRFYFCVSKL